MNLLKEWAAFMHLWERVTDTTFGSGGHVRLQKVEVARLQFIQKVKQIRLFFHAVK